MMTKSLDEIADSLKSVRSVRSKLVREGVYVASPKKTAAKQDGPSKKEILRDIKLLALMSQVLKVLRKWH